MWTPTTRMRHSRPVTRYQIDLTDAESRVIAPRQKLQSSPLRPWFVRQMRDFPEPSKATEASIQQNRCLDGCSSIAGADVGIEARPPDAVSWTALARSA